MLLFAPPEVTSLPSPCVPASAPTTPAPTPNLKTVAISSLPMQTTGTQSITPQETNMASSSLNSCPTEGNSTIKHSDGGWQYNEPHVSGTKFMDDGQWGTLP